jgi:hypothetical protein
MGKSYLIFAQAERISPFWPYGNMLLLMFRINAPKIMFLAGQKDLFPLRAVHQI